MASTLGQLNPLRYRGYVYDTETGFYYLQSRYYDPETGRFISPDSYISTGQGILGHNMFAYCNNNPVRYVDNDGRMADDYAGGAGELIGELIYEWITGDNHPNRQTRMVNEQITSEQIKHIGNGAKYLWDAYQRGYAIQQEAKLMEAQMMLDGIKSTYEYMEKHERLADGLSGGSKIIKGAVNIGAGIGLLFVPVPTTADDLAGIGKITFGIINVCYGIAEAVAALVG